MGFKVQVYIYDLTQGMARSLGPALLGRPLEGVWHTAIVVYGKEYFFGGSGIQWCSPGTTVMGQPLKVEELGETQITEELFADYLRNQSNDRFRGERYDLFHHNCNNFSHETAQFLVGRGIPQHIVDLPGEILATPMGQMLAPMLQQMTPSGTSIPFTDNSTASTSQSVGQATTSTSPTATVRFPVDSFTTFDQPLKVEGLSKKLEEFNASQSSDLKLSDSEVKVVIGVAKGLVRISDGNYEIMMKITKWKKPEVFPLLDILRFKCLKNSFDNQDQVEKTAKLFVDSLDPEQKVNSMLAVRGLTNMVQTPKWRPLVTSALSSVLALLPTDHTNLEVAIASLLLNMSVAQLSEKSLDTSILLASSLVLQVLPVLSQDEALVRALTSLGNIMISGQEEVTQFLLSLEVRDVVNQFSNREKRTADTAKELLKILKSDAGSNSGLDLD